MHSLFFVHNLLFSTFATPSLRVFKFQYALFKVCANKVGLSGLCSHEKSGKEVQKKRITFPFKLTLVPTGKVFIPHKVKEAAANTGDVKEYMKGVAESIYKETELYKVKAQRSGDVDGVVIGTLVTREKCVTSNFGDTRLFFNHQSIQDDLDLKPDWYKYYEKGCGCEGTPIDPDAESTNDE